MWSRAEARLRDTQAWETLEVPCSRQGGSDGQAFSYICVPVGSQQPLTGGQPTTPPVLKVPPCPRGLSGRVKDLGTRCSGAISAGGGTVGGQISESELRGSDPGWLCTNCTTLSRAPGLWSLLAAAKES